MDTEDAKFMRIALEEARAALSKGELPVGAVLVSQGKVVGRGHKSKLKLDHGEAMALRQALDAGQPVKGATVYTTLEPCVMCMGTLLNSRVARVVYALEDPYGGAGHFEPSFMPVRHKEDFPSVVKGVLRAEALPLFKEYFTSTENAFWKHAADNPLRLLCDNEK